jgi:hypothetical protein
VPGVTNLKPFTAAADANMAIADISKIFAEIHSFLPNVTFKEVNENSAADTQASSLGLGDVGTIRFVGFGDIASAPGAAIVGKAYPPGWQTNFDSQLGDIVLNWSSLGGAKAFHPGHEGYRTLEHEIGHALGLGDVTASLPTIMDAGQFPPVNHYTRADKLALEALYDALGTTAIASLGSTASSGDAANVPVTAPSALSNLAASSSLLVQAMASFAAPSSAGAGSVLSTALNEQDSHSFLAANPHHG